MITRERSGPSHRDQPSWVKLLPTFLQLQVLDTISCKLCNQCSSSPCTVEEIVNFLGYLCCLSLKPFQFLSCSHRTPTVSSSFLPGNSLLIVHTFNQLPCPKGMFNSIWVTRCFSVNKEHVVLSVEFAIKELGYNLYHGECFCFSNIYLVLILPGTVSSTLQIPTNLIWRQIVLLSTM